MAATRPHSDSLTATVTGTGAHRTLHYVIGSPRVKQVTFLERGPAAYHQIGVAHGERGTIRFSPVAGPGRVRQIVAQTVLNGVPAADLVVAPVPRRSAAAGLPTQRTQCGPPWHDTRSSSPGDRSPARTGTASWSPNARPPSGC